MNANSDSASSPGSAANQRPGATSLAGAVVVLAAACWVLQALATPLAVIASAVFIAMLVLPLHDRVRAVLPSSVQILAIPVAVLAPGTLIALVVGGAGMFVPSAMGEDGSLQQVFTQLTDRAQDHVLGRWLSADAVDRVSSAVVSQVGSVLQGIASMLMGAAVALCLAMMLLAERSRWKDMVQSWTRDSLGNDLEEAMGHAAVDIRSYLGAKTLAGLVSGGVATLICWGTGVPMPPLWGLLTFALSFVPNLGAFIAVLCPMALAWSHTGGWAAAVVAAGFFLNEQATGYVLAPVLQGNALDLPPSATLASVLVMGVLWGPAGVVLGVPLLVTARVFARALHPHVEVGA